ncbi:MAG: porin [Mangrovibacterium sp.]
MNGFYRCFVLVLLIYLLPSNALISQEVKKMPFGKGIINVVDRDSTWSVKLSARMQFLASTSINRYEDGTTDMSSTFTPRRIRLKLGGFAYSPKLHYFLQLGFSEQDLVGLNADNTVNTGMVYDAYIRWNFLPNTELKFGQFKLPGNVERMLSSGNMQFVDRSILNSTMNIDRDLGLMFSHSFKGVNRLVVRDIFSLTQGEGGGSTTGNKGGLNYAARVEVLPLGEFINNGDYNGSSFGLEFYPKLLLGFTYNFNDDAVRTNGQLGKYMINDVGFHQTDMTNIFIDAVLRYRRYSFMAEYAHRGAQSPIALNSDGSLAGYTVPEGDAYNVQAGYLFRTNWELSWRYSEVYFNHNTYENNAKRLATVALSRYLVEHKLKWQADFSSLLYGRGRNSFMGRVQFEIQL